MLKDNKNEKFLHKFKTIKFNITIHIHKLIRNLKIINFVT